MKITRNTFDRMVLDCRGQMPFEACGLLSSPIRLAGQTVTLDGFHPMRNISDYPQHRFELDSEALIDLYSELETVQRMPRAVYHSHVVSEAYPSPTDIRYAADESGLWHVIVSLANDEPTVELFEIRDSMVMRRTLQIV